MVYDLLPKDEPGKPLLEVPPGFTDALMQRIADHQRKERRRRRLAILLMAVLLAAAVAATYMLRPRRAVDGRKQGAVIRTAPSARPLIRASGTFSPREKALTTHFLFQAGEQAGGACSVNVETQPAVASVKGSVTTRLS